MFRTVELPLWALLLILGFAAVTFASHFLFPSVRWFLRRRMERVVTELNKRLERPIQPFKLARRHDTIQRLIYDTKVIEAVNQHAHAEGVPEAVAFEKATRYAREIVPRFSASVYFGVAIRLTRWLSEALYQVHVDDGDEDRLRGIDRDATLIFVMNHRSNMDYVLVTYLVARRSVLSYAVGEWARIWPLSGLIRSLGAFFIRRKSRNTLYRRVLARYVQMSTAAGVTQAVFPEGGLSLTGGVAAPRLGLLSYVLAGFDPARGRDVVFVPVGLNYDRVIEDRVLVEAAATGERRFRAPGPTALRFAGRFVWRRIRGRGMRFGNAAVGFGAPLSLREFLADRRGLAIEAVADELMARIRAVVPVLPVPVVAHLLTEAGGRIGRDALAARAAELVAAVEAPVTPADPAVLAQSGVATLVAHRIVAEEAGEIRVLPGQEALVAFYARSIAHHLDADAASEPALPKRKRHKITKTT